MNETTNTDCESGSAFPIARGLPPLSGSESQIAWAGEIRVAVNLEFDRVSYALEARSVGQSQQHQKDTLVMLQILEENRAEVMAHDRAGYFIKEWQERGDQVRLRIVVDSRCKAISDRKRAARAAALLG